MMVKKNRKLSAQHQRNDGVNDGVSPGRTVMSPGFQEFQRACNHWADASAQTVREKQNANPLQGEASEASVTVFV